MFACNRYYCRNKKGLLINAPYVDCSYKYAGGGFLSSVGDLLRFGNAMLYSYQHGRPASGAPTQEAGVMVDYMYLHMCRMHMCVDMYVYMNMIVSCLSILFHVCSHVPIFCLYMYNVQRCEGTVSVRIAL